MQTTSHLLMVRPIRFNYNPETATNNAFQKEEKISDIQVKALLEFDAYVDLLCEHGIDVTVVDDTPEPHTPDSIFPNNWISFHTDGSICLYPMYAANRRLERKGTVLKAIEQKFTIIRTFDLTHYEQTNVFLEGTGSMILDRPNGLAYACLSPRTDKNVFADFCTQLGYSPVCFMAVDADNNSIYHTNVMMCVGEKFVVICLDSIADNEERRKVVETIERSKKTLIDISFEQMNCFAGNMLQVRNNKGELFLLMSDTAYRSLSNEQIIKLESYNTIIHPNLQHIETNGGGSARCMVAEVFLPTR